MKQANLSYRIWFTQRSGSTLLCKALESTGVAGMPGEHFNIFEAHDTLSKKYDVDNFEDLKQALWKKGTGPNGVFGIKHTMHKHHYTKIFEEVKKLQQSQSENHQEVWSPFFPNCKHIYLTRRNKVRQVVSWWRAIQDNVWHLEKDEKHSNKKAFYEEHYNFDALTHLFKESVLMQCNMQQYFDEYNIRPMTVVYEDFLKDFEGTIFDILDYLEIDRTGVTVGTPFYNKTSDEFSEIWVERFRQDAQKNFDKKAY